VHLFALHQIARNGGGLAASLIELPPGAERSA
jgi:hypothetical protein